MSRFSPNRHFDSGDPETLTSQLKFRRFMAYCVLIASGMNSVVVICLIASGLLIVPLYHLILVAAEGILCFGLYVLIRRRPAYLMWAVWTYLIALMLVQGSTDLLNVDDPMRFTWHFAANAAALAIGGLSAGFVVLLTSIVSIIVANEIYSVIGPVPLVTLCTSLIVTTAAISIVVYYVDQTLKDLQSANDRQTHLANTDALTGMPNRLAFDRHLSRLGQGNQPFSLVLLDLDRFKAVNDTYGHASGDAVLRMVARVLTDTVRQNDLAARIGGEEFCLLLEDIAPDTTMRRVEDIRQTIERQTVEIEGRQLRFTASFGVAHSAAPHRSSSALLSAADHALYDAKNAGRNCYRIAAGA